MQQIGFYVQDQICDGLLVWMLGSCYDCVIDISCNLSMVVCIDMCVYVFSYCVGVLWKLMLLLVLYLSVSMFFLLQFGQDVVGWLFFFSYGCQIEVGIKFQFEVGWVFYIVVLFQISKDYVFISDLQNVNFLVDQSQVCFCGLELEVCGVFLLGLNLLVVYIWMQVINMVYVDLVLVGKMLMLVLCYVVSLWLDYMLGEVLFGLGMGVGVCYMGVSYVNVDNSVCNVVMVLFDVMLWLDQGYWCYVFNVSNLVNCCSMFCLVELMLICFWVEECIVVFSVCYCWQYFMRRFGCMYYVIVFIGL